MKTPLRRQSVLSRGQLAAMSGVNSETIRYYETVNLMPEPQRSPGGHRVYDQAHLKRLCFIKRCRQLGFALKEIRELLELVDGGHYTCAGIRDHTTRHLNDVDAKIRDLLSMQRTLQRMIAQCDGGLVPKCPIVDELSAT